MCHVYAGGGSRQSRVMHCMRIHPEPLQWLFHRKVAGWSTPVVLLSHIHTTAYLLLHGNRCGMQTGVKGKHVSTAKE